MMRISSVLFLIVALASGHLEAGVFTGTAVCSRTADCAPLPIVSAPNETARPFAVTHPPTYDGSGGALSFDVCVLTASETLIGPTQRAIATWNALIPTTENCTGCSVWEESPAPSTTVHAETTLLHELGHCPLGLGHPDRNWDAADDGQWEFTSFTRSWGVAGPPNGILVGPDFIRGTFDDIQQVGGGGIPSSVHWFRIMDNNPFMIDGMAIDTLTYSRSIPSLPVDHDWAANANRVVGEELGLQNTQAVMYGLQVEGEVRTSLTADDVNMVKMALTGVDFLAGTSDDYTVEMQFVDSCDNADVLITFGETTEVDALGECRVGVDYSFPQNPNLARNLTLVSEFPGPLIITLNQTLTWDTGFDCGITRGGTCVFSDGFESGDTSGWN